MYSKVWPVAGALSLVCLVAACSSVEDKQLEACVEDIKLSLNDPGSLEVLSTEAREGEGQAHHLRVEFTAKNKLGGRVRASVSCGFKTKNDTVLDPDDFQNQLRDMKRTFDKAGIDFP